jgi:hypothetical protein
MGRPKSTGGRTLWGHPLNWVDVEQLHDYLWRHSDFRGVLILTVAQIAKAMDIDSGDMSRIMKAMGEQGRLSKINYQQFRIVNPVEWRKANRWVK